MAYFSINFKIACNHTVMIVFICEVNWLMGRPKVLTKTHGAALAVHKRGAGTGHWGARDLVTHDLGLLPLVNIYIRNIIRVIHSHRESLHVSFWLGTTWQVHLVQLSTTQSSLSSNRRPSCQHMFFSLVFLILPRASFMSVFSSVWTHNKRRICSWRADQSERIRTH